jgi:serine/threonine protein phosphatase PrpC
VAHVGDSTAYLFDDSVAEKLTPEHRCDNADEVHRVKYFLFELGRWGAKY